MKNVATSIPGRLLALALATALAGASSALAQSSRQPYAPSDIQGRIERSGDLQRQALRSLGDPTRAEQLVRKAYDELQTAQSALIINASGQKFPDPLLEINSRKLQDALSLLQRASDALRTNQGARPDRRDQEGEAPPETPAGPDLDAVRSNIEQALRLASTVIIL